MNENVSAILQRKLPPNCKDLCTFTIPCVIGNTQIEHAMLNLGATINIICKSLYASLQLSPLKEIGVIIQLANHSNTYPEKGS